VSPSIGIGDHVHRNTQARSSRERPLRCRRCRGLIDGVDSHDALTLPQNNEDGLSPSDLSCHDSNKRYSPGLAGFPGFVSPQPYSYSDLRVRPMLPGWRRLRDPARTLWASFGRRASCTFTSGRQEQKKLGLAATRCCPWWQWGATVSAPILRRRGAAPAAPDKRRTSRLADLELDHLERVMHHVTLAEDDGLSHGLDAGYWHQRICSIGSTFDLVPSQISRLKALLQLFE
jgi:hypothetical protein